MNSGCVQGNIQLTVLKHLVLLRAWLCLVEATGHTPPI